MGVDLERDGQARVAEDELGITRRDSQSLEQRRDGVPDVVHLIRRMPFASQIRRNERTKFRGPIGRPVRVVKTRSVSGQADPISAR